MSDNPLALFLQPGTLLGPYEIVAPIGAGGMGEVWKARDTRLSRIVAIKQLKGRHGARFEQEARAIASLNHPLCQGAGLRMSTRETPLMLPIVQIVGISCWANVLRRGQSIEVHHHDPGYLSAHYTVKTGYGVEEVAPDTQPHSSPSALESGHTVYYRPGFFERSQGEPTFGSLWDVDWRISVKPQEGNMTFFPSYVRHEVRSQLETAERISIAMDIYIKKQELPFYFAPPRWYVPGA